MDRLQELKEKGYKHLSGPEKEEYRHLIAVAEGDVNAATGTAQKPPKTAKEKKGETITVTKSDLAKMVAEEVTKQQSQQSFPARPLAPTGFTEAKPKEKAKPVATLRKWRKDSDSEYGLMVNAAHHKWEYDEDTRKHDKDMYKFTFLMPNGKEEEAILPYLELTKMNDVEIVRILEMEKKEYEQNQGYTRTKFVDKDKAIIEKDGHAGERVEVIVKMDGYPNGATVQLESGRVINVPVSALNA